MKRLLCIAILALCLTACKKDNNDLLQNDPQESKASTDNVGPIPAPPYDWSSLATPTDIFDHVTSFNQIIEVNNSVYCLIGYSVYKMLYKLNSTTKTWARSSDFGLYPTTRILFGYGSKIYVGLSDVSNTITNDFKSYDITTGVTTTLSSFPGTPVAGATLFVIGSKGYLLGGETPSHNNINQLWEFNFITNLWTNKGGSPLGGRVDGSAFVVDSKAYIGLGFDYLNLNGQQIKQYKNDWVLYDPSSIYFAIKADFPGQRRQAATGFVLNNTPYVGLGHNGSGNLHDFYKYNTSSNTWTSQANWPGNFYSGNDCEGFALGSSGYVVSGALDEFWRFSNSPFSFQ